MLLRSVRCRGELGFALLKGRWRTHTGHRQRRQDR
jgi:hypothetical protein